MPNAVEYSASVSLLVDDVIKTTKTLQWIRSLWSWGMGSRTCEPAWQLGCRCNYQGSWCSVSLYTVWTKSM